MNQEKAETPLYTQFRDDGWPFCPDCGYDELYSLAFLQYDAKETPTLEQYLEAGMRCYNCNFESHNPIKK